MNMPTKEQMDQAVSVAAEALADMLNITKYEALKNHQKQIFHMVCAYAATECQ